MAEALRGFHPLMRRWFLEEVGHPTEIQRKAWPIIGGGRHTLVVAPTGSGKTLTAFLWALNRLVAGEWPADTVRILYVSPLKALNNDVRRNLLSPLAAVRGRFQAAGLPFPDIRVSTRSGDTPARERQRMQRRPPAVLITTPESLNILLASRGNRSMLHGVATVILDEIHSVLGGKRGVHLITAVDRLVRLSGDFQRIGLTATVRPLEEAASFLGGFTYENGACQEREVTIVRSEERKKIEIRVSSPEEERPPPRDDSWWEPMIARFRDIIRTSTSTLFFTNSRRLAEKVARLINEGQDELLAYSHHGSLSREIRLMVERRLKAGELSAIVATSSLELGIDIGAVDKVVMVQTPLSLSSAFQRIGRSGHQVGATSRGVIFPSHGRDFLDAVVTAEAVSRGEIEETRPIRGALDVLAQIIVAMTTVQEWRVDELYDLLRGSYPYHDLKREHFDLVLEMLAGRYAGSRIRELAPRVALDRLEGKVRARERSRFLVYLSGGTIPNRGYYGLKLRDGNARIGELDEEFVWERSVGESFVFGNQAWRITKIDSQAVEVIPAGGPVGLSPFWKAEVRNRDFALAEKTALFLEEWNTKIHQPGCRGELQDRFHADPAAAERLAAFLLRQKEITGADLPHRHHLVIEHHRDPTARRDLRQVILHTVWGGKVNQPLSMALAQAWEEKYGRRLETAHDDAAIMLNLPAGLGRSELLELVDPGHLEALLRRKMERTGFFGARFREAAGTALLLPRAGIGKRTPLWLNRLRARKLLEAVLGYEDFPILIETWRTCLQDEFDLPHLSALLSELRRGIIQVSEVQTAVPSPFAADLIWRQTNTLMYRDDTPETGGISRIRGDFIQDALLSARLEPELDPELVREFTSKLQRTAPGYSPATARELLEWIKERIALPTSEWEQLGAAMQRDQGLDPAAVMEELAGKVACVLLPGARETCRVALELVPRLCRSLGIEPEGLGPPLRMPATRGALSEPSARDPAADEAAVLIAEWLRYHGPVSSERLADVFGLDASRLREIVAALREDGTVFFDVFTPGGGEPQVCDAENLEKLLYLGRSAARPSFEPLEIGGLTLFLAERHALASGGDSPEHLKSALEKLFGYPLPVELWEREILPARVQGYSPSWLDGLMAESDLIWRGAGRARLTFCFEGDLDLFNPGQGDARGEDLFPDSRGRYGFWDLAEHAGENTAALTARLWRMTWAGRIANDSYSVIRRGIATRFRPEQTAGSGKPAATRAAAARQLRQTAGRRRSAGLGVWRSSRPLEGSWFMLPRNRDPDPLEREEILRARIQLLLERYGVLFRELLTRELRGWQWSDVFPSLRIMELSGEILGGYFFRGIPGPQFISSAAFRTLSRGLDEDRVFLLNAMDPISPCGLGLEALKGKLPRRLAGNHLVYHGSRLVLAASNSGSSMTFHVEPGEPAVSRYVGLFGTLLEGEIDPLRMVRVSLINGRPALSSPYTEALLAAGFVRDYRSLVLRAPYRAHGNS